MQAPLVDPFAALTSPMRQSTPQQPQPSMFDFANPKPLAAAPAPAADDDEWAFSSALPESQPSSNTLSVSETQLGIALHATREPTNPSVITMNLKFSSNADQPISELTFMAAVTKVCIMSKCMVAFANVYSGLLIETRATKRKAIESTRARRSDTGHLPEWSRTRKR